MSELSEQLNQFKEKITDIKDDLEQVRAELDVVQREKGTLIDELDFRTQQHLEEKEDMEVVNPCLDFLIDTFDVAVVVVVIVCHLKINLLNIFLCCNVFCVLFA